jgi:hypothetical protein
MNKSVLVLAVPHPLQGPGFAGYVKDPAYSLLIEGLIKGADFVFEEAGGRGPSTAENLAESILTPGHYLDVDPPPSERHKYGIEKQTGGWEPIDRFQQTAPGIPPDGHEWSIIAEQEKREKLWLDKLVAQPFEKGLMICGVAHTLSFAFRLSSAGIGIYYAYSYIPPNKLCTRAHES